MPSGFDAVFISNIIHSENARTNQVLFHKCYRGLGRGGIVVIKDHVMDAGLTQPAVGAVFSLYLLLTTSGRDYSFEEISGWLRESGFADIRRQALPSPPVGSAMVTPRTACLERSARKDDA